MSDPLGGRYWKLWTASAISSLCDGLYRVALPLIAVSYTRSPILVSLVSVCAYLPWLLFALQAGALADRVDRRRIMVIANGVRFLGLALFAICAALGIASFGLLCILALILGIGEVFFDGTAQAILPMVVQPEQLDKANGRLFAVQQIMESFVGQAGGGVLVSLAVTAAVSTTAALYGLSVAALLLIAGAYRLQRSRFTTVRQDIAEGVVYLLRHRLLRTLAVMSGVMNLANTAFISVFVLYVVGRSSVLHLPAFAYGLLLTATAVGATAGSLLTERAERRLGRVRLIGIAVLSAVVAQAVPAATASVVAVVCAFVAHGAGIAMWNVVVVSLRQRIIPQELMGRVNSCYRLLSWGAMPIGALLGGGVAGLIGLRGMFGVAALISLSLLLGMRVVTQREITAAEEQAQQVPQTAAEHTGGAG